MKAPSMEQLYQDALNPQLYPVDRLLAVMQGRDNSIPMAVAMAAKQQRDRLMTASQGAEAAQQMQTPTVRDQMLAQAAPPQMAESGVAALPAENMQTLAGGGIAIDDHFDPTDDEMQSYAGGGMVAFNTGGMPSFADDDEDDDDDDDDKFLSQIIKTGGLGGFAAGANMLRQKIGAMVPKSYESALAAAKQTKSATPAPTAGESHKDIALKAAQEKGATPWLVEHVMNKETGGHKDPARAVSPKGATGVMQLMPGTAREMGVSDITDPYQNIFGGVGYLAKLERKYGDPKLAAIAYNWGPGNTDKWLKRGGDFSKLPKETRNYVKNLAKGGIISFANTGSVPAPMDDEGYYYPPTETPESEFGRDWQLAQTRRRNKLIEIQKRIAEPIKKVTQYFGKSTPKEYDLLSQQPNVGKPATTAAAPAAPAAAPAPLAFDPNYNLQKDPNYTAAGDYRSAIDKYFSPASAANPAQDRINDYFLNLAKQQKEAQGLGLLGTGLRIAGGTSPYASANIGQGGAAGIQDYLTSRKALSAAEAQGLGAVAATERNKLYQDLYKQRGSEAQNAKYATLLENIPKAIETQLKNITKIGNFDLNKPGNREKYIQQETYKRIMMNPELKRWYLESSGLSEADLQGLANPSVLVQTAPEDKIRK